MKTKRKTDPNLISDLGLLLSRRRTLALLGGAGVLAVSGSLSETTMGGVPATVSYAGLVGTGLYQLNIMVPAMSNGTYPVLATVKGVTSQSGVTLKIQS